MPITPKKNLLTGLIIYVLVIGTYLTIAIATVHEWRRNNIDNSPTVYITSTGVKYHRAYHYQGRNSSISLSATCVQLFVYTLNKSLYLLYISLLRLFPYNLLY